MNKIIPLFAFSILLLVPAGMQQVFAPPGDEIMVLLRPSPFMFETDSANSIFSDGYSIGAFGNIDGCDNDGFSVTTLLRGNPTGPLGFMPPSNYQSDPFVQSDPPLSQGMKSSPPSDLGLVDTIVKRGEDIVLGNIGDTATVDIEMVSLSLVSVAPISIPFNENCLIPVGDVFFEIHIEPASSTQPMGSMSLERTGATNGFIRDWQLPADTIVRYENRDGGPDFEFERNFLLRATDVPFSIFPIDVIGGEIIPIETTSLILAGAQTPAVWMLSALSALGIGAFWITRNPYNIRNIKVILQDYLDRL